MEMKINFPGGLRVNACFGSHTVLTDQRTAEGGEDSAPSPFALFLASLGTCTGYYVLRFCRQRGLPTDGIQLTQRTEADPGGKMVSRVVVDIHLPADFPIKYRNAVIKAAEQCTVKKHLECPPQIEVITSLHETEHCTAS
jgi:putative redox protein